MVKSISDTICQYNERYFKDKLYANIIEDFGIKLQKFMKDINAANSTNENEEYYKGIINRFLKDTFYQDNKFAVNTNGYIDSTIKSENKLLVLIEAKKPSNKIEMPQVANLNKKGLWEIVFYYLVATRDVSRSKVALNKDNMEIRRLIITDSFNWFIFDANDIEKICTGSLEKLYFKYSNNQLSYAKDNTKFFNEIRLYFENNNITSKLDFVYFNMNDLYKEKSEWKNLYKIFSEYYLLKNTYRPQKKAQVLNNNFYHELLYILGMKEVKINGKIEIIIEESIKNSIAVQVYQKYKYDKEVIEKKAYEKTFELAIIWMNRLLFIKLFEGQLITFNSDVKEYHILDSDKIKSFQDLQDLLFNVLGKQMREDSNFYNQFSEIPYLNSSLFERQEIEKNDININEIKNDKLIIKSKSILSSRKLKELPLLDYIIDFLNSYDFGVHSTTDGMVEKDKDIIDASVLGLIFEKINGYKDGSHYTKSTVTEYMAKESIERVIISKINHKKSWKSTNLDELKFAVQNNENLELYKELNDIINSIKICDPGVGSGHYLVSVLNRIIAIKKELGILFVFKTTKLLLNYDIYVQDDILNIIDAQGNDFVYNKNDVSSQQVQETLFNEKRIIIEECLFGVDINPNAVYISQLRLWIELLKNAYYKNNIMETLPNIDINIKNGNSLLNKLKFENNKRIGSKEINLEEPVQKKIKEYRKSVETYKAETNKDNKKKLSNRIAYLKKYLHSEYEQLSIFDNQSDCSNDEYVIYHNALEWAIEFPEILKDNGAFMGFDCVIGNPPYGVKISDDERKIYKSKYNDVHMRIQDTFLYFISLANRLVNNNGIFSYIVPSNLLYQTECEKARDILINQNRMIRAINLGDSVFSGAHVPTCIFVSIHKKTTNYEINYSDFRQEDIERVNWNQIDIKINKNNLKQLPGMIIGVSFNEQQLVDKIKNFSVSVKGLFPVISQGITTGCNSCYILNKAQVKSNNIEKDLIKPVLAGCNITEFSIHSKDNYIMYIDRNIDLDNYPNAKKIMLPYIEKLSNEREVKNSSQPWYYLHRARKKEYFECNKILLRQTGYKIIAVRDDCHYYAINSLLVLNPDVGKNLDLDICVAAFNSKIMQFLYNTLTKEEKRGFAEVKPINVRKLYIPELSNHQISDIKNIFNDIYSALKSDSSSDIEQYKEKIDAIFYEACSLTNNEIQIVEKIAKKM